MPLYEVEEGTSRKFYRVELVGSRVHLHWGKIGTEGERQVLELEDEYAAKREYERRIDKRIEHGYRLVRDEAVPHDREAARKEKLARTAPLGKSPRFYFVNKKTRSFVWVEARENDVLTAEGPLGTEPRAAVTTTTCASPAAATKKRDAAMAALLEKGFALADFAAAEAKPKPKARRKVLVHNEELEAAIRSAPIDDEAGWSILEDWLLEQEDPRAEIVRLEKSGARGDAAQERGRLASLLFGSRTSPLDGQCFQWRAGFARECTLELPWTNTAAVFEALCTAPAMRLLHTLTMGGDVVEMRAHFERLATAPFAGGLRTLTCRLPIMAEELAPLFACRTAPNLRSLSLLTLADGTVRDVLRELASSPLLPRLQSLALGANATSPAVLREEHGAAFDHLTSLRL